MYLGVLNMRISRIRIENYKSFLDSGEIKFTPGFNAIVGQNNSGKTALIEALSLNLNNNPHKSLTTIPFINQHPKNLNYSIWIDINVPLNELPMYFPNHRISFKGGNANQTNKMISSGFFTARFSYSNNNLNFDHYPSFGQGVSSGLITIEISEDSLTAITSENSYDPANDFGKRIKPYIQPKIFVFRAERFHVGQHRPGAISVLKSDARNLPQVLNFLQNRNPDQFNELIELVNSIFPFIKQITIPQTNSNGDEVKIFIWNLESSTQRDDLAFPLQDSGTGIGQVLAILYVVLTSVHPQIILIDEPQSFLHPGAVRKLFNILQKNFSQHQYIISTHSPAAIGAANPQNIVQITKNGMESMATNIDLKEATQMEALLSDVGARLSDVFGADNILWVEGPTEEKCFPEIINSSLSENSLLGTVVLPVLDVGAFETKKKKQAEDTIQLYKRLSESSALMPPAVGFVFDRENRTIKGVKEILKRAEIAEIKVEFLPRKMYENYLLSPEAIAAVVANIEGFSENPIAIESIRDWIENPENHWNKEFFKTLPNEENRTDEYWLREVHGADLLNAIFKYFSIENSFEYSKIENGLELTRWLIENDSNELQEVAKLLDRFLDDKVPND